MVMMMMNQQWTLFAILSFLFPQEVIGGAIQLTLQNFEEKVEGKSVFIKASY